LSEPQISSTLTWFTKELATRNRRAPDTTLTPLGKPYGATLGKAEK
jgi:hypothetical protein